MPKTTHITYQVASDPQHMARVAAEYVTQALEQAIAARGVARFAISGGTTPRPYLAMLSDPELPFYARIRWDKIWLFWVDERCVPPDSSESNYRMTKEALLSKVPIPSAQIFRMEGELDPEQAAARYESAIRNCFRLEGAEVPSFDLVALGMGPDGHTASLFPGTEALHELMRLVAANYVPQKEMWRITLTAPVINHGRKVFFLIAGQDKAEMLHKVLLGPYHPESTPSQMVRPDTGDLFLIVDAAAAAELPAPDNKGVGTLEVTR